MFPNMARLEVSGLVHHNAHVPRGIRNSDELLSASKSSFANRTDPLTTCWQIVGRLDYSVVKTNLWTVAPNLVSAVVLLCVAISSDYFSRMNVSHHLLPDIVLNRDVECNPTQRRCIFRMLSYGGWVVRPILSCPRMA